MPLTPHAQLQQWLLLVLGGAGGSASRAEALTMIEARFGPAFSGDDVQAVPSRPFEAKWRNRVSWQRDRMVKQGLLHPYAGPGTPWSLTEAGWSLHQELATEEISEDPLAHFKPKSSGDYVARLSAQVLVKQRSHEQLVSDFGQWAIERGFSASTEVHPRDLVLGRDAREWLVEAKVVYLGNATRAVREATAQLLMYRHLLYEAAQPTMLALFSESIGDLYVRFLSTLDIGAAWRTDDGWAFSLDASDLAS
jgi:hypothetical protein